MDSATAGAGRSRRAGLSLVADWLKKISSDYGVLLEGGIALRGTFIIDQKGILQTMTIHDLPLGRSIDEALAMLPTRCSTSKHGEVCPAGWTKGCRNDQARRQEIEGILRGRPRRSDRPWRRPRGFYPRGLPSTKQPRG
ncbi:MAG: hypothetical protein U0792_10925 [Gemmataceae bacterium]